MADADVAVGPAHAYLVAEITSAALACIAQEANHFTYSLRSGGRQALYNNSGGSSAKNGACLCIGLANSGRGQALLLFWTTVNALQGLLSAKSGRSSAPGTTLDRTSLCVLSMRSSGGELLDPVVQLHLLARLPA